MKYASPDLKGFHPGEMVSEFHRVKILQGKLSLAYLQLNRIIERLNPDGIIRKIDSIPDK